MVRLGSKHSYSLNHVEGPQQISTQYKTKCASDFRLVMVGKTNKKFVAKTHEYFLVNGDRFHQGSECCTRFCNMGVCPWWFLWGDGDLKAQGGLNWSQSWEMLDPAHCLLSFWTWCYSLFFLVCSGHLLSSRLLILYLFAIIFFLNCREGLTIKHWLAWDSLYKPDWP